MEKDDCNELIIASEFYKKAGFWQDKIITKNIRAWVQYQINLRKRTRLEAF